MRVLRRLLDSILSTDESTYADLQTMFGRTRVYDTTDAHDDTIRVLDVEGGWQSGCYLGRRWAELAFAYHRAIEEVVVGSGLSPTRLLVLGGGALSYPKYVVTHHPHVWVDVVEIDRAIIELARRYFFLDRLDATQAARLNTLNEDAAAYLKHHVDACDRSYDVIVNDAFAAFDPPRTLMSGPAVNGIRTLLSPDGLYLVNVVAALEGGGADALFEATQTLGSAFEHVLVLPLGADEPTVPDNNIVIASDGSYALPDSLPLLVVS